MEKGGVQFAAEQEPALLVPAEGRTGPATVLREGLEVPGGVGEFEDAGEKELANGEWRMARNDIMP
ncbi:MAG: hypothetical protein BWY09_02839 [Candidatus Hydrogenedentes bacterium ADurb.Bin179]|nr:MAG: hypothetical protein BWY09_02839 [Candidatus Hydrogenedentes bacterium ADurb.Bin179]